MAHRKLKSGCKNRPGGALQLRLSSTVSAPRAHYINNRGSLCQEGPYHSDSTTSSLLSEVKHCRARLVLRWGTTLESLVLFFCFFCQASCGYLVPCPHGASKTAKTRPCWNSWCCSFAFFCQASCGYLDQESIRAPFGSESLSLNLN